MSGPISDKDRKIYRGIVDALLPATEQLPAASAAGVADEMLDRILSWRPDLLGDLMRGVRAAADAPAAEAIRRLEKQDPPAYAAIRLAALGAYYLDPGVMTALRYPGRESRPVDPAEPPDYQADRLLDPVLARGPTWRQTEPTTDSNEPQDRSPMKRHVFFAFTNPAPGREADYNDWQDNEHVPHGLKNPGFVAATRYKLADAQFAPSEGRAQYVTIWEIESDDIAATLAQANERQKTAVYADSLDFSTIQTAVYSKIEEAE
jgi:hypothetical protein